RIFTPSLHDALPICSDGVLHLVLQRIELLAPFKRLRIDSRKLQSETRFPRARFVVDLVRCYARVPSAVFSAHADPRAICRWYARSEEHTSELQSHLK